MARQVQDLTSIVETIRKIAEAEVKKLYISELGVVTSIFPHSDDNDKDNYECTVKLKDKNIELRKVPVATPQVGLVSIPHIGDLVLISFINGDINSPVIIGRLYNDEDRPPTSKAEEFVYKPPYQKNVDLRRFHLELPESQVIMTIQDEQVKLHIGETAITINKDGAVVETKGDFLIKAKTIKLQSDQATDFTAGGKMTIKGSTVDINP